MKLCEFLSLSDPMQYQSVWDLGVHIDTVIYNQVHYHLYAVGDFYVEIHYRVADNAIIGKLAFRTGDPLDKYLIRYPFSS